MGEGELGIVQTKNTVFMTYPMHNWRHIGYLQWFTHACHILICDGVTNTRARFSYV